MSILVVSVSHKTAPMDLLSRLTLDPAGVAKFVGALVADEHVEEAVVLSTCNRTEVYAAVTRFHGGLAATTDGLATATGVGLDVVQDSCAVFYDEAAVSHCFSVTSGLDSMVAGEHQILGQVRSALAAAQAEGTVGTALNSLFQQALRVGKRVHSETSAGSAGRSLVTASLDLLDRLDRRVEGRRVLIVGAGSMAALAAHTVADRGGDLTLVNRTFERADHLARAVGGRARTLVELDDALAHADVLITCTGARGLVIGPDRLAGTPVRGVIDLALPADVADEVGDLDGVELVNLGRLQTEGGFDAAGSHELGAAHELVGGEVKDFLGLRRAAQVAPTVVALRTMANQVVGAEMDRLDHRLPDLDPAARDEIAQTVRRVVEKLLHQPTVRVKELAALPDSPDYAAALRELFALDHRAVEQVSRGSIEGLSNHVLDLPASMR
ncbi:glutamyl-tRNA reductase [Mariniluteicoccus flavus]